MFTRRLHIPVIGMSLVLLASCGSGGGGGSNQPPTPPPNPAALPITATNAQDITKSVLEAVTSSIEIVDIVGVVDVVDIPIVGSVEKSLATPIYADITEVTTPCDTGQVTATLDDVDNNGDISTGDTIDVEFEMCFFADTGTTLDGATSFTNLLLTGGYNDQIPPWSMALTFGFVDLSGADSMGTSIIDGTLDLDISADDDVTIDLSVGTASLTVQDSGESETLSDYLLTQAFDLITFMQVINASGVYTSTVLGGSVTFETVADFMILTDGTPYEGNPSSGQMLISDSTSSVLVTVIDNISVQLEIDSNLDGMIDSTIVVAWDELDIG